MGELWQRAIAERALAAAWEDVLANDREDGVLGAGVARFAEDPEEKLDRLAQDLAAGTYRPGYLTRVELPKPDGRTRLLEIPPVRDRIVERALLTALTPLVDPWLGPAAYAYRPGLGVADAIQAVARLREEGLGWVARADIADCFPSIPVPHLRRLVTPLIGDSEVLALVEALLVRRSTGDGGPRPVKGLPQGSPLSPLWSNLVLADVDVQVVEAGFPLVRYGDDLVAPAESREEAWEAMRVVNDGVEGLGMRLGTTKSEVMSFHEGFCFLGEDFGPRYPPAPDDHRVIDPPRRVLYVGLQGSRVRIDGGRCKVESPQDQELLDVPSGTVERLVCFGAVGVSAGFRSWALAHDVEMVFCSRRGSYLGHAHDAGARRSVARLRAQLTVADDEDRAMVFARAVVEAKVRKQIILVQRAVRRDSPDGVREQVTQMRHLLTMVPAAETRDEAMGLEGAAARAYFAALGGLVPEEVRFTGRSRRPPQDMVNAALSYGYTILCGEVVSALYAAGLDPAIGLFHAADAHRPSLALDVMEEFRPLIVDQVVLAAARRGQLRAEHGRREDGVDGVLLTRAGREAVIGGYEKRMLQHTKGSLPEFSGSLRRHLYRQCERLAAFVHDPTATWTGLSWR